MTSYKHLLLISLLAVCVQVTGCAKPHDVDTPCPDYGRQCAQMMINVDP